MALSFTPREARELLARLDDIQRKQQELMRLPAVYQEEARDIVKVQFRYSAAALVAEEAINGKSVALRDDRFIGLTANTVRFHHLLPIADYAQKLNARHQAQVQQLRLSLSSCAGGLRRMFASSGKKQDAQQAFDALSRLLSSDYAAHTEAMTADADRIRQTPDAALFEQCLCDRAAYLETAKSVLGDLNTPLIPEFEALTGAHDALLQNARNAEDALSRSREAVRAACERAADCGADNILAGVPVEEVNRSGGGYRVKTLRDSGFETLADIAAASDKELSAVKGISPEGAQELKKIAADYGRQSRGTVKLRLSADERTAESTAVVCAICQYLQKSDSLSAFAQMRREQGDTVSQAQNALREVGGGLLWVFTPEKGRLRVSGAYRYLNGLLHGAYGDAARQLSDQTAPAVTPQQAWEHFTQNTVRYYNVIEDVAPGLLGNDNAVYGLPEELAHAIWEQPFNGEGLRCELRRYQEWGVKYALHQKRVLLGDEMGLGKTVQAIAVMVSLRNEGQSQFLVVCPASVLSNWCREIQKHSDLGVTVIHGSGRDKALASWRAAGGVGVTTFETTAHITPEEGERIDLIVVDEAHYIKNASARRSINVKRLCEKAERLLFMTGTAIENRVDEMIALVEVLQPALAQKVKSVAFMSSAPQFREAVAPVYYRRRREDVLTELPEKVESPEWCKLGKEEERLYEQAVLAQRYADARRVSWAVDDLSLSCKASRLCEILDEARQEGRKVIVFSFFLDTIGKISAMLSERCVGPINGSIPPQRRQELIDSFEQAPAGTVLTAQIQSGGTGLNIQCASVVILCEPQFKPSVENQAISRAYRMGQARNVLVYRLLCENTVDEKIMDMLREKQAVFDAFADKSSVAEETMELDEKSFGEIMRAEAERINAKYQGALAQGAASPVQQELSP